MINEPGFEPVFNGEDFAGIKFVLGPRCKPAPFGCAKTEPGNVLWVENGTIACACHVHGYWYTEERYLDFTLRFDYRFERPPHWEGDDELFAGGSGYLLFAADVLVTGFPRSLEIEGRHWDLLDVYAIGGSAEWTGDVEARRRAMNPLGEWNAIEIVSRNGQVRNYLNGTLVSTVTEHNYTEPGHIAFQSQGARIVLAQHQNQGRIARPHVEYGLIDGAEPGETSPTPEANRDHKVESKAFWAF